MRLPSSRILPSSFVPRVVFFSEAAVLGTSAVILVIIVGMITRLPLLCFLGDWWGTVFVLVLFAPFHRKRIVKIVHIFGVMWLRVVWIEALSYLLFLSLLRIRVAATY